MRTSVFLVTGIPGAGKTTVGKLLAERFERGVHIEADALQRAIVSGGVWPGRELDEEALRQMILRARNAGMLADSFVEAGFVTVVDDVIAGRDRLDLYLDAIRSRPLVLVVLAPSVDVTLHRDAHRGYKNVGDRFSYLDEVQRRELGGTGLWIDTGQLTPQETVDAILERADEGLVG